MLRVLPVVLLLVACNAGKRKQAVEPAPWQSESGKQETRIGIAARMLAIGEAESALALLQIARKEGATEPEVDLLLGMALYQSSMFSEAERELDEVSNHFRKDARLWRTLGLLYADTDRTDEAIDALNTAVELDDNDAATWNNLGFLLFTVRRDPKAVPALQTAVTLDSSNARYKRNLAFALFNAGRVDEARKTFESADTPADAMYNLGLATERAGDLDGAKAYYQQTLEIDPTHLRSKEALERIVPPPDPMETP